MKPTDSMPEGRTVDSSRWTPDVGGCARKATAAGGTSVNYWWLRFSLTCCGAVLSYPPSVCCVGSVGPFWAEPRPRLYRERSRTQLPSPGSLIQSLQSWPALSTCSWLVVKISVISWWRTLIGAVPLQGGGHLLSDLAPLSTVLSPLQFPVSTWCCSQN